MIKLSDSPTKYIYSKVMHMDELQLFALIKIDQLLRDKIISLKENKIELTDRTPYFVESSFEKYFFGQEIDKPFCFLEEFDTSKFEVGGAFVSYFSLLSVEKNGFKWVAKKDDYIFWETPLLPYSVLEQPK